MVPEMMKEGGSKVVYRSKVKFTKRFDHVEQGYHFDLGFMFKIDKHRRCLTILVADLYCNCVCVWCDRL